ncbi:uncharacterized protein BDW47DRAFT_123638 [Aspergillus candidus]|uniref:Urease accessory protein UreD n=1 Tax=Aspergillus candidus TaxID=41067 RepID=A0A2I2FJ45_ASPCN|nr:hypothetical protein BDW47DRAFT_123638 [Aspergillus candidus]PLB40630.1 hypothetical protein BDW47DRAFT_123638 [Aspergillus candidus]
MPHKHKRRGNDANIYDLPPSMIAKALPVRDPNSKPKKYGKDGKKNQNQNQNQNPKDANAKKTDPQDKLQARRRGATEDDTPKAFLRLMQRQPRGKLAASAAAAAAAAEAGEKSKKRKRDGADKSDNAASRKKKTGKPAAAAAETKAQPGPEPAAADVKPRATPKILPGERLSDFAARVDRELPLSMMNKSNKPAPSDLPKVRDHRLTKHEKHLRRLQEQWRKDDVTIREKEEAQREEREEEMEEQLELWKQWEAEGGARKAKKKGGPARKKAGGEGAGVKGDADPWAKLNKKERSNKPANLFDVAEAPPHLTKPTAKFKVRDGARVDVANVPVAAGSLRRREELAGERKNIVEEYRRLMAAKRQ